MSIPANTMFSSLFIPPILEILEGLRSDNKLVRESKIQKSVNEIFKLLDNQKTHEQDVDYPSCTNLLPDLKTGCEQLQKEAATDFMQETFSGYLDEICRIYNETIRNLNEVQQIPPHPCLDRIKKISDEIYAAANRAQPDEASLSLNSLIGTNYWQIAFTLLSFNIYTSQTPLSSIKQVKFLLSIIPDLLTRIHLFCSFEKICDLKTTWFQMEKETEIDSSMLTDEGDGNDFIQLSTNTQISWLVEKEVRNSKETFNKISKSKKETEEIIQEITLIAFKIFENDEEEDGQFIEIAQLLNNLNPDSKLKALTQQVLQYHSIPHYCQKIERELFHALIPHLESNKEIINIKDLQKKILSSTTCKEAASLLSENSFECSPAFVSKLFTKFILNQKLREETSYSIHDILSGQRPQSAAKSTEEYLYARYLLTVLAKYTRAQIRDFFYEMRTYFARNTRFSIEQLAESALSQIALGLLRKNRTYSSKKLARLIVKLVP